MSSKSNIFKPILAFLFIILTFTADSISQTSETVYKLNNGIEVILKENHSSPMIATMIFVKSGSKYESQYENGITHFLEHLLFDGTVNKSREEIDLSIRNLGGYINAFTRKEMTAYMVLVPKQYIEYGMTVQADMLFNSVFPDEELPKERKVVIEEINRDKDSPSYAAEKFFYEKAYANTDYNKPVLGYEAFINNIPREAIVDYWKRYYRPEKMTILVIGDFDTETMKTKVNSIFSFDNVTSYVRDSADIKLLENHMLNNAESAYDENYGIITGEQVFDTVANIKSTQILFSFNAPKYTDSSYLAFDLLTQYLGMDDISPLMKALKGGSEPMASEVSVYISTYKEFSRLEVSVITDKPERSTEIVSTIIDQINTISNHSADLEALDGIKTSIKTSDIYNSEKLHYLGFMIGQNLMVAGWDFVKNYAENISKIEWTECQSAAREWLNEASFVAAVIKPAGEGEAGYEPFEMTDDDVIAHFDTTRFNDYVLDSAGVKLFYPATDSVSFELVDNAKYVRKEYDNGMVLLVKSAPNSRVFAMNVIGKNRTGSEPDDKTGITDFVNRCIEKGTTTRNASELSRDLAKIGANVTLYDNPWIPYDDRYTTRLFSFMKFETIDDFAFKGFHLFADMIEHPAFDSMEIENVRNSMMGIIGRNSGSPSNTAKDLFFATMFEGNVYDKPIMGTARTIGSITRDDLKKYHALYYSPGNIILSITTDKPVDEVIGWVDERFGLRNNPSMDFTCQVADMIELNSIKENHKELDKEQISIFIGSPLPNANHPDVAAIQVATSILSTRLYLNLREKQGLAYSVGAGSNFDKNCGWYYSSIGTAPENYQTAIDGIKLEIDKLKYDGPTSEELNVARNKIWGQLMSSKLSSINQAYYLGVNEYLGRTTDYDKKYLTDLAGVTPQEIRRVMAKYIRTDIYVKCTAGKMPQ